MKIVTKVNNNAFCKHSTITLLITKDHIGRDLYVTEYSESRFVFNIRIYHWKSVSNWYPWIHNGHVLYIAKVAWRGCVLCVNCALLLFQLQKIPYQDYKNFHAIYFSECLIYYTISRYEKAKILNFLPLCSVRKARGYKIISRQNFSLFHCVVFHEFSYCSINKLFVSTIVYGTEIPMRNDVYYLNLCTVKSASYENIFKAELLCWRIFQW